jgi:hypothetical protein
MGLRVQSISLSQARMGNPSQIRSSPVAQADELLTTEEAASYLGIGISRLYQMRQYGAGPVSWREGRRLVYPRSQLDLYRARQRERTLRGETA